MTDFIGKIWRLPWEDRMLLAEAATCLGIAALAVAVVPFRHVGNVAGRQARKPSRSEKDTLPIVDRVRWAVEAAARRVPWRALCFEQGLAAQQMLRRRGVQSVLYYGAARSGEE